jgi:hypothetical protein
MIDPRYQAGKHLSLVELEHLDWLSNIPGHVVPAYSMWGGLCAEVREAVESEEAPEHLLKLATPIDYFMLKCLKLSVSVKAKGRADMRAVLSAEEEAKFHRDAGRVTFEEPKKRPGLKDL